MKTASKANIILALFIIAKFVLQYLLIHPSYDLHRDEYLHLDQAHHLAWGYSSVPPFTSWVSWIILQLGNSEFWVKFFPALFGALTILLVWKTVERLGGNLFAKILVATILLFSVLLRLNILYQPNSVDVLCWTAIFYFLVVYLQTSKPGWLYWIAIVFAIGFLNKYNIVFLIAGLAPALLLTEHRKIFTNKHFYLAVLLALVLISPNLYWQWKYDFPVVRHMQELATTQLHHINRLDFLLDQVFFFFGGFLILLAGWIAIMVYPPFKTYRFLLLTLLFTLFLFIYLKAKSYYAIGLYPVFVAFGAVYLERFTESGRRWIRFVAIAFPLLLFIPMLRESFPVKEAGQLVKQERMHRWEDGKDYPISQDFSDMIGWRELAEKTDKLLGQMPNPEATIIICDNYGEAGAINYYSKNKNYRAYSFNADYRDWLAKELKNNRSDYTDVILVREPGNTDNSMISPFFEEIVVVDSITTEWARERGTSISWLKGAKTSVREVLGGRF